MDNTITMLEDVTEVKIVYIYVNIANEVEQVVRDTMKCIQPNMILKSEIIDILKTYISKNNKNMNTYTISSILQYNVDLPAVAETNVLVEDFINEYEYEYGDANDIDFTTVPFFSVIKQIRDIYWKPTLPIFKELNELTIIFYANKDIKYTTSMNKKKTKKIYITQQSTQTQTKIKTRRLHP